MSEAQAQPATAKPTRPRSAARRAVVQVLLIVVILAGAFFVARLLFSSREAPPREAPVNAGPLVAAVVAHRADVPVTVDGHGTVEPRSAVDIVPQVGGRVIHIHPALIEGGQVLADDTLIQIDPADYRLALRTAEADLASSAAAVEQARAGLDQAQAAVRRAQTALALEQAEAQARTDEWRDLHGEKPIPPLVAREPQIREKQAELASAEAQLHSAKAAVRSAQAAEQSAQARVDRAKLDLERTIISPPFDGRVRMKNVDLGQFVNPGQVLASMYATDRLQIAVPLADGQLAWFDLPDMEHRDSQADLFERGVPAQVTALFAGALHEWTGRAVRTTGQVDPRSRLVDVVVEVNRTASRAGRPLVPGMFVDVSISGRTLTDVIRVPRHAVRADDEVWVVRDGRLRIVGVDVARADREHAYVRQGLRDGEIVVTSQLDVVTDGMSVRVPADVSANIGDDEGNAAAPASINAAVGP